MTKEEFSQVMAFLEASVQKSVSKETSAVYWEMLGDLPADVFRQAAKRAVNENQFPVLPPIGVLRRLATESLSPPDWTPAQAFKKIVSLINAKWSITEEMKAKLPLPVRQAADAFGWQAIADSTNPEACRAQFAKCYEVFLGRERGLRMLPPAVREQIAVLRDNHARVERLALGIGVEPGGKQ